MSNIPKDLRYTADHEYARKTDAAGVVQVGITDYAQGELGDVVYVDLPKVGAVLETNGALEKDPAVVNRDPYGAGWMIKLKLKTPSELDALLSADAYKQHI